MSGDFAVLDLSNNSNEGQESQRALNDHAEILFQKTGLEQGVVASSAVGWEDSKNLADTTNRMQ